MKKIALLLTITAALIYSGCARDNSDDQAPEKTSKREWYDLVKTDTLSNTEMLKQISGFSLPLGSSMVRNTFLYHYVNGSDTLTLSGAVCWPLNIGSCSEIWFESHYFSIRWDQCPSQQAQSGMVLASLRNSIYIGGDYQGLGLSRNLNQPYLNTAMLAEQNINCFKAAITLLKDYGPEIADDYQTYNIGYSLGGAVSMGVAKQVELNQELMELIHLKKTFCGGGPYDQTVYFDYFLDRQDMYLDYPVAFLCAIKSIINSDPSFRRQFDITDCFSDKILENRVLDDLDSGNLDTDQINQTLRAINCNTIQDILSAQALDKDSQVNKAIFKSVKNLDLPAGWIPKLPILVRHSKTDTYVPFVCMEHVMDLWADKTNIVYETIESGQHTDDGITFYMNLAFNKYPLD